VYRDGKQGAAFAKRFAVTAITRDKEYILTRGNPESKVLYFTEHPNGEAEIITVHLRARPNLKRLTFDYEMAGLAVKNMQSQGNLLTKYSVNKISQKEIGGSTLQAQQIWFDDITMRLNISGRGELLGRFRNDDKIQIP